MLLQYKCATQRKPKAYSAAGYTKFLINIFTAMKKSIIIFLFIFSAVSANACPYCGCGVGNFYMGIVPDFKTRFVGIRYQYMQYHTQIAADNSQFGNDYYNTAEIWGGLNVGKKWQLIGFIPYHFNKQVSDDGTTSANGLGDITLIANYRVFKSSHFSENNKVRSQELLIGGGLKLPTGKNNLDIENADEIIADANSQMGTGSVDFLLSGAYNVRLNKFGINTSVNYKINTNNSSHYSYGNRFNASSIAYYALKSKGTGFLPNAGLIYEHAAESKLQDTKVDLSGGHVLFATTGIEFSFGKTGVGLNAQLPLTQNFAAKQTQAKFRGLMHVSFSF